MMPRYTKASAAANEPSYGRMRIMLQGHDSMESLLSVSKINQGSRGNAACDQKTGGGWRRPEYCPVWSLLLSLSLFEGVLVCLPVLETPTCFLNAAFRE